MACAPKACRVPTPRTPEVTTSERGSSQTQLVGWRPLERSASRSDMWGLTGGRGGRRTVTPGGGGQSHRGAPDDDKAGIQGTRLQDEKSQDRQQGADVGRGPGEDSHPGGTGPAGPRSQRPGSRRLLSWPVTPVGRRAAAAGGWSRPCPLRDPTALPDESLSPSPWCRLPEDLAAHPPGVSGDPARPEMQSPLPAAAPSRAPAPSVHTSLLRPGFK